MIKHMKKAAFFLAFLLLLLSFGSLSAHPWGGLVMDQQGNIYFTFVCPMVDADHYACVWKIDNQQELSEVLESSHSPSDIILSRSSDRMIYAAERNNAGGGLQARLWSLNTSGTELIIKPTTDESRFFIQAYAVDENGRVFFARKNQLFKRDQDGNVTEVKLNMAFDRIDDLAWGGKGQLYILDRGSIKILDKDGTVTQLADGLKEENPENIPFSGANILFDIAVDKNGMVYVAYYGNRRVLQIDPSGEVSVFLHSEGPWSPHGIDVLNGEVYILESTVGATRWWEFWEEDIIIPRVRKVEADGKVTVIFEHELALKE